MILINKIASVLGTLGPTQEDPKKVTKHENPPMIKAGNYVLSSFLVQTDRQRENNKTLKSFVYLVRIHAYLVTKPIFKLRSGIAIMHRNVLSLNHQLFL